MPLRHLAPGPRSCASNGLPTLLSERMRRQFSQSVSGHSHLAEQVAAAQEKGAAALSHRWLSDLKSRIGKCICFGLRPEQLRRAGSVLKTVSTEWRELVAGSEGFLTGEGRAGLEGHRVFWGEMDTMQHINNVTYTRYAESARVNWTWNFAVHIDPKHKKEWSELMKPGGHGLILRSIRTEYKFPMTWPDKVSVYHKLRSSPSSLDDSFILDAIILSEQQQRAAARCQEDLVVYDYEKGKKTALRPFMVEAFRETIRQQEETKEKNTRRVLDLLREVEILEEESWDKIDAKEDFGGC